MTIGFIVFGSISSRSGGYLYDRYLIEELRSAGHRVEVISQRRPWDHPFFYPLELLAGWSRRTRRQLAALNPEVVVIDELNHAAALGLLPFLRRLFSRTPVVGLVHHLRRDEPEVTWRKPASRYERCFLTRCDALLCNSRTTLERIRAFSGDLMGRPAHIATPGRREGKTTTTGSERRGICFVGNIIPRKNLHVLVKALALLPEGLRRLDVYGSLTADPRYTGRIRRLTDNLGLAEAVTFYGDSGDDVIREAYRTHAALAVPSSYEGFGIVYLEAMMEGCIPIAGSEGGAGEIISSGKDGYLVPPGDAVALAERLRLVLTESELRERMARAAVHRAREFPTWKESMAGTVRFLEQYVSAF